MVDTMFGSQCSVIIPFILVFLTAKLNATPDVEDAKIDQTSNTTHQSFSIQSVKSIYYNLSNHEELAIKINDSERITNGNMKFTSRGVPCECSNLQCECCTGVKIGPIDLNKTCARALVIPEEFAMQFSLRMKDKVLATHTITGRNPSPLCYPLYVFPIPIKMCVRFYDIRVINETFNMCADFETKIDQWSMFVLHFDCMQLNMTGRPSIGWFDQAILSDVINPTTFVDNISGFIKPEGATEIYDKVDFEDDEPTVTQNSTIEEKPQVGSLKF